MISNASCSKCTFFDDHMQAAAVAASVAKDDGLCRFNPPITQPSATEHGLWPVVSTSDWCGHFAPEGQARQVAAE